MITSTLRRPVRFGFASTTIATGMAGAVLLWSPGAVAAAGCTTTTPSIGQTIVCDAAGTETITVPTGANAATVVVIGAGGGSGPSDSSKASGAGGNGGKVSAELDIRSSTNVTVQVGAAGVKGWTGGGGGGGYSSIQLDARTVVVAGGGGGGAHGLSLSGGNGGDGGSGAATGTAAGGAGGAGPANGNYTGGGGGNADGLNQGTGGAKGDAPNGAAGASWNVGGTGGSPFGFRGGGGSGYGGGASGGDSGSAFDGGSGGGAGGSFADDTFASSITFEALGVAPGSSTAGAGGASRVGGTGGFAGQPGSVTITFFIRTNPAPSTTSSPTPTQRSMALDFTLPSDVRCNFTAVEASQGSWVQVPSASDCTISGRATESVPTLLGWATDADFPVAIAQRQVDNGWGAYETKDEAGQLTGVFIPAGGYTSVTSDTNLHPIWSD